MAWKFFLSVISYMAITFGLAYPWHFIWFKDLFEGLEIYSRESPIFALGILSIFIQGVILAYLFPKLYKGGDPVFKGIKFALIMGLFLFSVSTLANAAKIYVSSINQFMGIQVAFHFIQFFLAGAMLGIIHGPKR